MTENEAKRQIKEHLDIAGCEDLMCETEALEMAMSALEEIPRYRDLGTVDELAEMQVQYNHLLHEVKKYHAVGTVEEFKALKKKAEPKKPIYVTDDDDCLGFECPCCREMIMNEYSDKYCADCGQKLDWS